jgi:hypothetical protein
MFVSYNRWTVLDGPTPASGRARPRRHPCLHATLSHHLKHASHFHAAAFVPTFNCSIRNMNKCWTSRLLVYLCLQASFFVSQMRLCQRGSKHRRIRWGRGWWHRQWRGAVIELYVMYLCHKTTTMYWCVKTIWIVIDLYFVVWILYALLYNFLLYDLFWRLSIWRGKQKWVI